MPQITAHRLQRLRVLQQGVPIQRARVWNRGLRGDFLELQLLQLVLELLDLVFLDLDLVVLFLLEL